jgi:hypothetical protein
MSEKRKRVDSPEEEEEERVTRPIKPIPASKLQAFTIGSQKKSAFQKHKEEADLKKQVNFKGLLENSIARKANQCIEFIARKYRSCESIC